MELDLDSFDDILPDSAAKNSRGAGRKFQPKVKPQPKKEPSASGKAPSTQSVRMTVSAAEKEMTKTLSAEKSSKNNEDYVSGVGSADENRSSGLVNPLTKHVATTVTLSPIDGLDLDAIMHDSNEDWHSCFGKSEEESADIFCGLELLDDCLPQSTTPTGSSPRLSETPTAKVSNPRNAEEGHGFPVVSPVDDLASASHTASTHKCPEIAVNFDPLICGEVANSDGDLHMEDRRLETEGLEVPCLDTLDIMSESTPRTGLRKFQPKPKVQVPKENSAGIPDPEAQSVPSQTEYIDEGSIPAFPPDDVLDFSSLGFSDSIDPTSGLPVNEEPSNFTETSHSDASIPGEYPEAVLEMPEKSAKRGKRKTPTVSDLSQKHQRAFTSGQADGAGRSLRPRRKKTNACELVDESEDEAFDDGESPAECPSDSVISEDYNNDEEHQVENEFQNKRARRNSKKPVAEKKKPVRKRNKANEASDLSTEVPVKKFSHSTRRNRRRVNKDLLEIPEDEIDFQKLPIRDLILLAEYKERISNKDAKTSETPLMNQSAGNSGHYNEDEAFASEQGRDSNDEQASPRVQESSTYFNYQTHMVKTSSTRWSKQDTELFYEAVQQFGTDLSMIQHLFPGRTRRQVKLKYKKEERQHPLRLREALTNRAKDHSHFQLVIERLQQIAAQEKQNSNRDDSVGLAGKEEAEEEEVAKSEQLEEEVQDLEPEATAVQSPVKSDDSEDDLFRWSQYKSEL